MSEEQFAIINPAPDTFTVYCPYCRTMNNSPSEHILWTTIEIWETDGFVCVGCNSQVDIEFITESLGAME